MAAKQISLKEELAAQAKAQPVKTDEEVKLTKNYDNSGYGKSDDARNQKGTSKCDVARTFYKDCIIGTK